MHAMPHVTPSERDAVHEGAAMRAEPQQWLARRALTAGDLTAFDVWVVYVGLGGSEDGLQVDAYLNGLLPMELTDRDLIARAVNVLLEESEEAGLRAPLREDPAWVAEAFGTYPAWEVTPADLIAPLVGGGQAEALRLASLERTGLLRPGSEEELDAVTAEAARRFPGCSSSLALITADRQIIKSLTGTIGSDGPRATSFCHRTVEAGGDGPFVVTDASTDVRVSTNPLVTGGPRIRFYAGYPVCGPGGWRVGSLCVISDRPRAFTAADALRLEELATRVQGLIGV